MKRTKKLTVSAAVSALCVAFLALSALLPNLSLSFSALAGLFPAAVVICCGSLWSLGASAAAAALALLLLPDKTAAIWFCLFFGHYPVWKAFTERCRQPAAVWALKLLGFLVCGAALYLIFRSAFLSVLPSFLDGNSWAPAIAAAGFCVCFILYDLAFSRLISWFIKRILPHIM